MRFVCALDATDHIEIEVNEGKPTAVRVPIDRGDPVIGPRLRTQLDEPVPLMMFLGIEPDASSNWCGPHANFLYRNQLVAVSHIGSKTKEEIALAVTRFVLEREQRMERERKRIAILELTAPRPTSRE